MNVYLAEAIGTMILLILGDGVVANVLLNKSKGQHGGWMVITTAWGLAVIIAIFCVGRISGAHLNPAVTVSLAAIGSFPWAKVPGYILAQVVGAFFGAVVVWVLYLPHFAETEGKDLKLAVFCTAPAIRRPVSNFIAEVIGSAILLFGILAIAANAQKLSTPTGIDLSLVFSQGIQPILVGFLVWGIGLSLGGPTGYAINPARDLGPRLAHAVLPIAGKGKSDWGYAWIPVIAPLIGGVMGAGLFVIIGF
ncbi:MAG TPA: MIP/aquaporin family protein [Pyrinomonadaceae bacterium]